MNSEENLGKVAKSVEKCRKVGEKWRKLGKVEKSGKVEKWRKVAWCGYMWFCVAKSGFIRLKVAKSGFMWFCFKVCTVQITFIFIGQTRLVFGKRICTCVTKHSILICDL